MRWKRKSDPSRQVQQGFPTGIPGRPWFGLYYGDGAYDDGSNFPAFAGPEASMMVLGPPRSGKTSAIVIPCVLDAPAAVVSTSTKPDVLAATIHARWQLGNCFVFDPSGTTAIPNGAVPLRWSPVTGCEEFERATSMAHALASASRPKAPLSEGAHWVERAEALLAPLLFAAALRGRDMATVCRWVLARDLREPEAVLADQGHEMARAVMAGVAATEDRERSGIFSTAAGLLAAYRSEAALASATDPNFDPVAFARSTDTVYICAPAHAQDQLAPLVVALLEQIRAAVYARPINAAPVVFALDEVAGIAPLPSLPALAAEGGGQGLITLACLQDLSQARARWGDAAEGFFSLFNKKVIFPGIGDHRTLQLISALAGDHEVDVKSISTPHWLSGFFDQRSTLPTTTTSVTWRPRMTVGEVANGRPGYALVIESSSMAYAVIRPWWDHPVWSVDLRSGRPRFARSGQLVRPIPGDTTLPPTDGEAGGAF
jgi:type IV secretory pathway TraG/TraD family ATPase VirD4